MAEESFGIGQVVTLKGLADTLNPPRFLIIEKLDQTCPGGTQHHYRGRVFMTNDHRSNYSFSEKLIDFLDIELAPLPEQPPPETMAEIRETVSDLERRMMVAESMIRRLRTNGSEPKTQ